MAKLGLLMAAVVLAIHGTNANDIKGSSPCEFFFIKSKSTGKCIDVEGYPGMANGKELQLWDCDHTHPIHKVDQTMRVDVFNRIQSRISGKCVDVSGHRSTTNGAKVQIWDCEAPDDHNNDQIWDFVYHGDTHFFQIKNRYTGKCLDVQRWSGMHNGKKIHQWDCSSYRSDSNGRPSDQWWYIVGIDHVSDLP